MINDTNAAIISTWIVKSFHALTISLKKLLIGFVPCRFMPYYAIRAALPNFDDFMPFFSSVLRWLSKLSYPPIFFFRILKLLPYRMFVCSNNDASVSGDRLQ
jgi:hypothetical protein